VIPTAASEKTEIENDMCTLERNYNQKERRVRH